MSWSLNEIESLAKKATRGAGYSWGLAEDAGKAVRWLCAMGQPGADCLAALLKLTDGTDYAALRPQTTTGTWVASGGSLCPLVTGAALCDRADDLTAGCTVTLAQTAWPLLLYPYIAAAADMTGTTLSLSWTGVTLTRKDGVSYIFAENGDTLHIAHTDMATVQRAVDTKGAPARRAYRGNIAPEAARQLNLFAHRIYAPETEERRLAGAGAGLTDND